MISLVEFFKKQSSQRSSQNNEDAKTSGKNIEPTQPPAQELQTKAEPQKIDTITIVADHLKISEYNELIKQINKELGTDLNQHRETRNEMYKAMQNEKMTIEGKINALEKIYLLHIKMQMSCKSISNML